MSFQNQSENHIDNRSEDRTADRSSTRSDHPNQSRNEDRIKVDTPEQISLEFPLAGIGSRFMALAIDTVIQILLYTAGIFAMIGIVRYAPALPGGFRWLPNSWVPALLIIFLFCIYWGYFALFEIFWKGQTPGKRLAGIRAIKNTGRALDVYEVIGRNLLRAVDALPTMYIAGIVSMMISRQNQRLGDHLVGSIVVHEKRAEDLRPEWSSSASQSSFNPQLSKITPEELVLIETYLQRRHTLDFGFRDASAHKIATRISAKTGVERSPDQSLDDFLESIARQVRDSARFR
ncbi:MAG: RDD family protein [Terriglobales bacterium]